MALKDTAMYTCMYNALTSLLQIHSAHSGDHVGRTIGLKRTARLVTIR